MQCEARLAREPFKQAACDVAVERKKAARLIAPPAVKQECLRSEFRFRIEKVCAEQEAGDQRTKARGRDEQPEL